MSNKWQETNDLLECGKASSWTWDMPTQLDLKDFNRVLHTFSTASRRWPLHRESTAALTTLTHPPLRRKTHPRTVFRELSHIRATKQ